MCCMTKILVSRIVTARVNERTADRLQQLAREADRSLSAEIRRAINEHIQHERPAGQGGS
jgi:predicted transcriptional regulator